MFEHSEFIKKTICHGSSDNSIAKKPFLNKILKTTKGDPSKWEKKIFSNFDETWNLTSLGPMDSAHQIWAKLGTIFFLR